MTATSNPTAIKCSYCGVTRRGPIVKHHAFCITIIDGAPASWIETPLPKSETCTGICPVWGCLGTRCKTPGHANDKSEAITPKKGTDIPVASYSTRKRTTIRHEYIIESPANWVEVQKAFRAARSDMQSAGLNHHRIEADDSVWVDKHGEDVIVYWDEEKNDDA